MPVIPSSACAKAILFGEHAVVYGEAAIALPISNLRVKALCEPGIGLPSGTVIIQVPNLGLDTSLQAMDRGHPIALAIRGTLEALEIQAQPSFCLRVNSNFPFKAGLGGSAALAVAISRSLSAFLGHPLNTDAVNCVAFQSEVAAHGSPSGIDNSVISLEAPLYYIKGEKNIILKPKKNLSFLIADTGLAKKTGEIVSEMARKTQTDLQVRAIMAEIGAIAKSGRYAFEEGNAKELGLLMDQNHALLSQLGLSCPELDKIVNSARQAGAYGAKLTGGGRGGCALMLIEQNQQETIHKKIIEAGAKQVFVFILAGSGA
ncbi:MAG: mevalonate kinase [Anaerolineaceae bacterium]|nr:mevalonate kinase [Anaerolineaceae bacterium]